uniref:PHM7_ext domain-containing protein n=1 Tax=Haemonchus placei TaxID=6290 RepID=A0A0N4WC39_HAEPC
LQCNGSIPTIKQCEFQIVESDVDVIGLSQSTKQVSIRDHDSEHNDEVNRLFTIINAVLEGIIAISASGLRTLFSVRHPPVRRSASSVSSTREHDVHEHFRRSLSGKWPRRSKTDDEKARASPITRRTSFNSHGSSNCTTQPHVIVSNSGVDSEFVVDHFRRALSEKDFENWQRKRNATNAANEPSK